MTTSPNPCSWPRSGTCWRVGSRVGMPPMRRPGRRLLQRRLGRCSTNVAWPSSGGSTRPGTGPALAGRLLEGFLAWIPVDLADLRAALDHGEAAQALRVTHRLKGAAGTVGSSGMVSLCEQLELHVRGEALSP